jgi:FdhE protein
MAKKKKSDDAIQKINRRIASIVKERPNHKEILDFFKYIIREQYKIKPLIKVEQNDINEETVKNQMKEGFPLIDRKDIKLDMASATALFTKLSKGLQRKGVGISVEAKKISQAVRKKELDLEELFRRVLEGDKGYVDFISNKTGLHKWLLTFLAESSINPILEAYADRVKEYVDQESWGRGYCPVCGSQPVIGELRSDGGQRFLHCSACGFQWRFKRLSCPFCGNEDVKKHRHFYIEKEGKGYRVDVCDECKKYIKTIDLKEIRAEVIPLVDDVGTLHLDILAEKEGYTRGVPGFLEVEKMEG